MGMHDSEHQTLGATSNRTLVERCAQGDQEAWTKIVTRYERLVFAVALRHGLSPEAAADATQQTFAELVKQIEKIKEPERLQWWLLTVVRRTAWRIRNQQSSAPFDHQALEQRAPADTRQVIDEQLLIDETALFEDRLTESAIVHEAIDSLGEPCRSLILGLFFDPSEPSYTDIAQTVGRPVGSIGPMRSRCLGRLRESLQRLQDDE